MKKVFYVLLLLLCTAFFTQLQAQTYLKAVAPPGDLGGQIIGDSKQKGHENEIEVLSYSQGVAGCTSNLSRGGLNACKASVGSLNFMMQFNPGLNQLRSLVLSGKRLQTADFVFEKAAGDMKMVYYKIHMEDVAVVTVQESGSSELPMVSVEFAAARIAWAIYSQDQTGQTKLVNKVGFNVATNTFWSYSF